MTELNFDTDRYALIEYVVDKLHLANAGDPDATQYIEFLWDHDGELLEDAMNIFYLEQDEMN